MRCVADESTGVKSCEMIGGLWRNDGGPLQCCEYEQNGTYFRASFGELKTSGSCDLDCFGEHPNTEIVGGVEYGIGNSCCPTTAYKLGLGICGRGCVSGELGIPARLSDGTVTCCSFEQHACWVDGLRPATGRMGTTCCDKEKHPYYNVISEQIECCDKTVMLVPETGGDMFHCCNADEEAYLIDANTPGCCKGKSACATRNGKDTCVCCTTANLNSYAYCQASWKDSEIDWIRKQYDDCLAADKPLCEACGKSWGTVRLDEVYSVFSYSERKYEHQVVENSIGCVTGKLCYYLSISDEEPYSINILITDSDENSSCPGGYSSETEFNAAKEKELKYFDGWTLF